MVHLSVHGLVIIPIATSQLPKEKEMQLDFTELWECLVNYNGFPKDTELCAWMFAV